MGDFNTSYTDDAGQNESKWFPPLDLDNYDYHYEVYDLTQALRTWPEHPGFIPTTMTYGLTFLLGVLGNGLVIFSLVGDRKARNVTSSFLISLAVADLVFLLVCVPSSTVEKLVVVWDGGRAMCKVARFVEMLSAAASVLNLTAVSIERYVVIVHSMKARYYCSMGKAMKYLVGVWVAAFILSSPTFIIMDTERGFLYSNQSYVVQMRCTDVVYRSQAELKLFAWYQLLILFILPVIVIVICYSAVIYVLWISNKELTKMTHSDSGGDPPGTDESRLRLTVQGARAAGRAGGALDHHARDQGAVIREARKQVIKMLMAIILVFFCCWGPHFVLNVMKKYNLLQTGKDFGIMLVIELLPFVQSCVNPIIYSFMSKNIRRSMRKAFVDRCHCDPGSCCQRHEGRASDSRLPNGRSRSSNSLSKPEGSASYVTVMSEC